MRDALLLLTDMVRVLERIDTFTAGLSFDSFRNDDKTKWAVVKQFEILGEASKHVPDAIKERHASVAWSHMARMRDRLIHGYFDIDDALLWETIHAFLPHEKAALLEALEAQKNSGSG